ncbi:hypothetical protein AB0F46_35285 [Streptomyces sp. NPDC026665]|uniref:hypothetical protein n=1 Tax=Streptomyces sp. NPDC026665 TaxID=3154798 RepID=UPI0033E0C974
MTITRCEFTELPVDGCAHCRGHTTNPAPDVPPAARPWFQAIYPGTCAVCGSPFNSGTAIRLETPRGWRATCCREDER